MVVAPIINNNFILKEETVICVFMCTTTDSHNVLVITLNAT